MSAKIFSSTIIDGAANPTDVLAMTAPLDTDTTAVVNFCNQGELDCRISLAVVPAQDPTLEDKHYLLRSHKVQPYRSMQYTSLVLEAGAKVYINATRTRVSVNISGFYDEV